LCIAGLFFVIGCSKFVYDLLVGKWEDRIRRPAPMEGRWSFGCDELACFLRRAFGLREKSDEENTT
jgi:hypothetical protein